MPMGCSALMFITEGSWSLLWIPAVSGEPFSIGKQAFGQLAQCRQRPPPGPALGGQGDGHRCPQGCPTFGHQRHSGSSGLCSSCSSSPGALLAPLGCTPAQALAPRQPQAQTTLPQRRAQGFGSPQDLCS